MWINGRNPRTIPCPSTVMRIRCVCEKERERERGKVVRISVRVCEKERKRPWRGIFRDFHCNTG